MNFYNPFRPHVIETQGRYYVRKLFLLWTGWRYATRENPERYKIVTWTQMNSFSEMKTHEEAARLRDSLPAVKQFSKVKVHL